jgi:putative hemolysin
MKEPLQIDVDKLFREKNPTAAKLIPRFVINWIKKTVHQEEVNEFLVKNHEYKDIEFLNRTLDNFGVKRGTTGLWNLPETGGAIIASNHPLGGMDGMVLITEAAKARKDVYFIVNDLLMHLNKMDGVFIPVNKHGTQSKENMKRIDEIYAGNNIVIIFPAGLCSRKQKGVIKDLDWNKSFLSKAKQYNLPVIPTYMTGRNSSRFYNISNIRKFLGIKANIEMFFLPDEMFRQRDKEVLVRFGTPVSAEFFDNRYSIRNWANLMREYVYHMNQYPEETFEYFVQHYAHKYHKSS